jgi:hypothetical protein
VPVDVVCGIMSASHVTARGSAASASGQDSDLSVQEPAKGSGKGSSEKLVCMSCKEPNVKHLLLLYGDDLDDWQGGLLVTCYKCTKEVRATRDTIELTEEEFKTECNKKWNRRKRKLQRNAGTARGLDWNTCVSRIGNRYEGQNKKEWRESIKLAIKALTDVMYDSFMKKSEKDQKRYLVAMKEHEAIRNAQAEDETFVPELTTEVFRGVGVDSDPSVDGPSPFFVDYLASDYASKLAEGLDNYYVCRLCAGKTYAYTTVGPR